MTALDLACAADLKYLPHCAAMLSSVFATTKGVDITVHFTHFPTFPPEELSVLSEFVRGAGARLNTLCVEDEVLATLPSTDALPSVVWQRVLLPQLLPDLDKILYLDSDVIALGSVEPLWSLDIDDCYVAAVSNPMHEEMADWPERIGLPDSAAYFNSGVLLMNLALLREDQCSERIIRHAVEHPEQVHWGDQCSMNVVLHARRYPLHPKWNVMNNFVTYGRGEGLFEDADLAEALADPQIVHFEGLPESKPWHYRSEHPYRASYLAHRGRTPWPLMSLEGRNAINIVKKRIPRSVLAGLRRLRQTARDHRSR
ncbi:glycosyltransferase family 8 protein [Nocardioides immobilis]|uniref:Glycosyltransferase family 8 protein n=1 Tax=Nocardioides immobilis TaxID=2049295 RepID=A0A417XT31_9ACTN|nr:glycosyltransferase family 8 protein [Nocardioides immobilis]RHW23503.1 glycosyltransferase family 8 protein [Nocardioides immobilis]